MKIILFFLVLLLLLVFTNNKREFFAQKIIGDISFEDYSVDSENLAKFYSDNLLQPRKMTYTLGEEGKGVEEEINTLSFKPENIKSALGDDGIKKIGGKEIANLEAVIPVLFYGSQQNYKNINDILVNIEDLKAQIIELKK
jgi:hypothetical protein